MSKFISVVRTAAALCERANVSSSNETIDHDATSVGAMARAYAYIREQILDGVLQPGMRLPEEMVAQKIGVSRTPVRGAINRLTTEGFVEFKRNVGAVVRIPEPNEIDQILEVRSVLEGLGAQLAARNATPALIASLERLCDQMEEIANSDDPDYIGVARLNKEFHRELLAASGNAHLRRIGENLDDLNVMIRSYNIYSPAVFARSMRHHRELVEALKAGNQAWAKSIMTAHIEAGRMAGRRGNDAARRSAAAD